MFLIKPYKIPPFCKRKKLAKNSTSVCSMLKTFLHNLCHIRFYLQRHQSLVQIEHFREGGSRYNRRQSPVGHSGAIFPRKSFKIEGILRPSQLVTMSHFLFNLGVSTGPFEISRAII